MAGILNSQLFEIGQLLAITTLGLILTPLKWFLSWRTPPKSVKGEIVLVTGGASGIGQAILLHLAKLERDVVLISWDTNGVANRDTIMRVRDLGVKRALAFTVDVSNRSQVAAAAAQIREEVGNVTMLFNNAAVVGPVGMAWEVNLEKAQKALEINFLAYCVTIQEFLPAMIKANKGHVVGTCSVAGFTWRSEGGVYIASKHAMTGCYESLKEDLRTIEPKSCVTVLENARNVELYRKIETLKTVPFSMTPRAYPALTASDAASDIIHAVLRNHEHIYTPSFVWIIHSLISICPPELMRFFQDSLGWAPLSATSPKQSTNGLKQKQQPTKGHA